VRLAGVCGSDLALLFGKNSPRLSPFFSFPAVLGHEILGEVDGVRVAVNPTTSCRERGLSPCDACVRGHDNLCANAAEGPLAAGLIGYNRDLPGGWGRRSSRMSSASTSSTTASQTNVRCWPNRTPWRCAALASRWRELRGACW
jgi:Zn-dependent alcohol dehydrogenase